VSRVAFVSIFSGEVPPPLLEVFPPLGTPSPPIVTVELLVFGISTFLIIGSTARAVTATTKFVFIGGVIVAGASTG